MGRRYGYQRRNNLWISYNRRTFGTEPSPDPTESMNIKELIIIQKISLQNSYNHIKVCRLHLSVQTADFYTYNMFLRYILFLKK